MTRKKGTSSRKKRTVVQSYTMTIGTQQAGVLHQAGRDQHVDNRRSVVVVGSHEAVRAAGDLRALLAGLALDPQTARAARADVDEIEHAAAADDRRRAGGAVERLTGRLERAGRLATAGTALVTQLRVLGGWLGPLGERVLQALPG